MTTGVSSVPERETVVGFGVTGADWLLWLSDAHFFSRLHPVNPMPPMRKSKAKKMMTPDLPRERDWFPAREFSEMCLFCIRCAVGLSLVATPLLDNRQDLAKFRKSREDQSEIRRKHLPVNRWAGFRAWGALRHCLQHAQHLILDFSVARHVAAAVLVLRISSALVIRDGATRIQCAFAVSCGKAHVESSLRSE